MGAILEAAYHTYLEQGTILGARDTAVTKLFFLNTFKLGGVDRQKQVYRQDHLGTFGLCK